MFCAFSIIASNKILILEIGKTLHFRQELQRKFAEDRNWDQYHTPRNLLMALVGEVGELAEILYETQLVNYIFRPPFKNGVLQL